jgi:hypothetical protein
MASSRRRRALVALAVSASIIAVASAAGALLTPSPELHLGTPTTSCSPSATVNLSWTDTVAGAYYRPLWKHSADANWQVGGWTGANARTASFGAVAGDTLQVAIESWTDHYRDSNVQTATVSCGTATTTTTRAASTTTTTRPASTTTTTRPPATTTTTRPATTTTTVTLPGAANTWAKRLGGTGSDLVNAVATDAAGNVYAVGSFQNAGNFNGTTLNSAGETDGFVVKISPSGTQQWVRRLGGASGDTAMGLAVDPAGNVDVVGRFVGPADLGGSTVDSVHGANGAPSLDMFVIQYNATGTRNWVKTFGTVNDDAAYAVATDAQSNVVFTGYFRGSINFGGNTLKVPFDSDLDVFVTKLSSAGAHVWSKNFTNNGNDQGKAIAIDGQNNIAVSGLFSNTINFGGSDLTAKSAMTDAFVAKFNAAGTHVWSRRVGSDSGNDDARGVAFDPSGNVLVAGVSVQPVDFGNGTVPANGSADGWVAKYAAANGAYTWAARFGGTSNDYANAVASDGSGNIYVAGSFDSTSVGFGAGVAVTQRGSGDAYVAKWSGSGTPVWARDLGGNQSDVAMAVRVGAGTRPVTGGYFYGSGTFDGVALSATGMADAFLSQGTP